MYDNRNYIIFSVSELDKIDFSQVLETSTDTVRRSVDGTKTFVKWEGDVPACINDVSNKHGPYTYEQIVEILTTSEWTDPMELVNNGT